MATREARATQTPTQDRSERTAAHFITQAYILHLAHAGFFDNLILEGWRPGESFYDQMRQTTIETIITQYKNRPWNGPNHGVATDMNRYIDEWGKEMGWPETEAADFYPFLIGK